MLLVVLPLDEITLHAVLYGFLPSFCVLTNFSYSRRLERKANRAEKKREIMLLLLFITGMVFFYAR